MTTRPPDYLAEWLHLTLNDADGIDHWQPLFEEARIAWQLERARQLLREGKRATLSQRGLAIVRHSEGMLYAQLGDLKQAVACLMQGVDLLEDSEYIEDGILLLNDVGMLLRLQGNCRGAEAAHRQALSLAEEIEQPYLAAEALEHLGLDLLHRENVSEALSYLQRALAQYEALGDEGRLAPLLNHLGEALWRQRDLPAAHDTLQRALTALTDCGAPDPYLTAQIRGNLGNVCYAQGDLAGAESYWRAALAAFNALGVVYDKVGLLNNLGGLALERGEYAAAIDYFQESLTLAQELGDQRGIAESLTNLGLALTLTNDWTAAVDCYHQVLDLDTGRGYRALIWSRLARLHTLIAVDWLRRAIQGDVQWRILGRQVWQETFAAGRCLGRTLENWTVSGLNVLVTLIRLRAQKWRR